MWYALQTETGKEQELINVIRLLVPADIYTSCFYIKRESIMRLKGECVLKKQALFPGYIFVITDFPDELYRELKQVPFYAKFLGREESEFFPITKEEEGFLESLINGDEEYTVRLSPVIADARGNISKYGGVLRKYSHLIVKKRIRSRYVIIRMDLFGRTRDIYIGIRLAGDMGENEREFLKSFSSAGRVAERADISKESGKPQGVTGGCMVVILEGAFEGVAGTVKEINDKKHTIGIEVEMFGRTQIIWVEWSVKIDIL